ncbi:UDP-N-acetylmuramoyl-tripeptide--D-alanyl-D-alanine ligase [Streptococcus tangpeifui]|uniref:UDP-N-acetylmuramoyl-tripeptide--D-alanyl-D- alanine ligase n=1 Tax=Streptococcus tangpeifui TaxID=2709400 RepID=UPI0013EC3832|nr:UDP-N-acetylmuramoyl-tripeptide--D-alanyl-D-alanine ligase [Streptococcus sp. ZJ373]
MKLSLYEIAEVVGARNDVSQFEDFPIHAIEFDSRKITSGDLFLPLKGTRDGHEFIPTAFENGAVATFSRIELDEVPYILVKDPLAAFQDLAKYYLKKMAVDVIAVTGSNGKTTTKDMIHDVLATTYRTYKTQGNYNNEIGLPYTVFHMPDDTQKIVLEMGQDHLGDIDLLSKIAQPKIGIVTLVGEAHLEFFGSREKIAQGKMQIVNGMAADGTLIAPADKIINDYLPVDQKVVRFGPDQDIFLTKLVERKDSLQFSVSFMDDLIELPVTGKYNATNAMLAAYVGQLEGVADEVIASALKHLKLTKNRTEWKKARNGADILADVYNANPTAMKLILETFLAIPANEGGKKIALLADMKELGENSVQMHSDIIMAINPEDLDYLICYGEDIAELAQLASQMFPLGKVYYFKKTDQEDQFEDLVKQVKTLLQPADQILLKGSNSMDLDKVVKALEE